MEQIRPLIQELATWLLQYWDMLLSNVALFIAWLASKILYDKYEESKSAKKESKAYDAKIFLEIRTLTAKWINQIRTWKVNSMYSQSELRDLFEFIETQTGKTDFVFLDSKWNTLRTKLFISLEKIYHWITTETYTLKRMPGYLSVPHEWELEQPERYAAVLERLEQLRTWVIKDYDLFIEYWRKRFKV